MEGIQLVEGAMETNLADVEAAVMPNPDRIPSARATNSSPIEIRHGAWRCRISPDTKIRVTSCTRLTAPLAVATLGIAVMIAGVALGVDPGFILGGGTLALLGADSCRRVRRVYTVSLDNGNDRSQSLSFADVEKAQMLVAELSAEVKRLRSVGKRPPATERPQALGAHAS